MLIGVTNQLSYRKWGAHIMICQEWCIMNNPSIFVASSNVPASAEIDDGAMDGLDSILAARPFFMG